MPSPSLLRSFEHWLREHHPAALATMNPGLDAAGLRAFERALGVRLPDVARQLYRWRDGQDSDTYETIPPDEWELLPSRLVLQLRAQLARDHGDLPLWRPGFIPFLCDPNGGFMCIDSAGELSVAESILELKPGAPAVVIRHDYFSLWLETVVVTLETGLYVAGQLTDEAAYHALFASINPSFPATMRPGDRSPKKLDPAAERAAPGASKEAKQTANTAKPATAKPAAAKQTAAKPTAAKQTAAKQTAKARAAAKQTAKAKAAAKRQAAAKRPAKRTAKAAARPAKR